MVNESNTVQPGMGKFATKKKMYANTRRRFDHDFHDTIPTVVFAFGSNRAPLPGRGNARYRPTVEGVESTPSARYKRKSRRTGEHEKRNRAELCVGRL